MVCFQMADAPPPQSLDELVCRLERTARAGGTVTVGDIMNEVGRRSFGPLLLAAGLVIVMPVVGDIPGVPVAVGLAILVLSVQMLLGRDHFWLPEFLLKRSVKAERLKKGCGKWLHLPARFVDNILKERLAALAGHNGGRAVAACCLVLGLLTAPAELVPFSANLVGMAVVAFGAALITRDGLVALIGYVLTGVTLALLIRGVL